MSGGRGGPLYQCPECGYDVSRTLADAIETCPECGQTITYALCRVDARKRSRLGQAALFAGPGVWWAALLAGLFFASVPMSGLLFGVLWLASAVGLFRWVCSMEAARGQSRMDRRTRAMGVIVINVLVFFVVCAVAMA